MPIRPPSILRDVLRSSRSRARPTQIPISIPPPRRNITTVPYRPRIPIPHRPLSITPIRHHSELTPPKPGEELHVTFTTKDGHTFTFEVADGDNLLDIGQAHDLEMEGACGGSCACSTCHVIVEDQEMYDKLEEPDDDENDMLDLAFGLTETSRLGCQVKMRKDIDGLRVRLPSMTRNMQLSDFK
ncbi:Adrenodoxin [Orbilia brochopaga]|nr:Adrenodoxin [Drechslerella brochopaga]